MKPETAELARYRLTRARESLAEARLLLDNDHVRTAVNRVYYACFYAVSALLLAEEHSSPKQGRERRKKEALSLEPRPAPKPSGDGGTCENQKAPPRFRRHESP